MATDMSAFGGNQPSDRLRLSASKGHMDKVKELVLNGASFQPDKVRGFNLFLPSAFANIT